MKVKTNLTEALTEEVRVTVTWADSGWTWMDKVDIAATGQHGVLKHQNSMNPNAQTATFAFPSDREAQFFIQSIKTKLPKAKAVMGG